MGETGRARGEAEIGRLRRQVLALADADCLRPEDGLALLATLDPALLDLAAGDVPAAGECIDRFISRLQFLMSDGLLGEREGRPPLEAAHRLLASMASSGTASALGDKLPSSWLLLCRSFHVLSGHKEGPKMRHGLYCGALGALALALSLAGAQPAPADNPNCQTQVFPFTSVGTNPCTGEQIAVAGTVTTTVCAVTDATGAVHGSVALQIAGMGVGDQGNSYTIQGPSLTATLDTNAQGDSESLARVHTNFISQGEAPDFVENCEIHIAIHNSTVQTIQRDDCTAECSGEGPVPPP